MLGKNKMTITLEIFETDEVEPRYFYRIYSESNKWGFATNSKKFGATKCLDLVEMLINDSSEIDQYRIEEMRPYKYLIG